VLNPPFEDFPLLVGFPLLVLAGFCGVRFASSFGEELDFLTEEGRSASAGEGLGFGFDLETGGGDLVKKLKMELCFDILCEFTTGCRCIDEYTTRTAPPCVT